MNSTHNLDELPWDILLMEREIDPGNKDQLMRDLHIAIKENQFHAFHALAIKYMEVMNWDSKKVEIIRSTNKLLMEPPRPSDDIPTEVFEALNAKILSSIQGQPWSEYKLLERFLASDPLLFRALSTRSCPLETQFYFCVFTRQTDDLLDEMSKIIIEFGPAEGRDQLDKYPIHIAIRLGTIHVMKLILIYESGSSSVCLLKDRFGETPLHLAVQKGLVSEINILLSTCWECAGMVSDIRYETALHCTLRYDMGYKAFKTLLEWYIIKEEFLNNSARDWECGDTALDLLVDGYVKTVKELLFQSESNVCFQRDYWETKEYFVVIKCKDRKSKYEDYVREVTSKTTKRTILSLSVDSRSIITLKVLIRSVMVRGILSVRDSDGYTVFGRLDKAEKRRKTQLMEFVPYEEVECAMGTLLPKWCNKTSDAYRSSSTNVTNDAKEQLGEGTESCHEGVVAYGNEEQISVASNEPYQNVLRPDHRNGNAEDDNKEPHNQEMSTDINISDKLDGYSKRKQVRISLWIGQEFATLEECRNAIKDVAILGKTGVTFTKSTRERIVAECSDESCKWKIRAQAKSSSKNYVVTEIAKEHTCPRLNGTTNKLATPIWVSSHIIDSVRQEPNISTQQIKDIMKESNYKINITCKTAERAKKRALVTIQLQEVSKKQRQNTIASSSLSSNAHQSLSNLRFLEQIPEPMHKYIHGTEDVEKDGHCGYRVIAMQSGYEAMDAWKQVRTELLIEVVRNEELYVKLMDIGTVAKMRKALAYSEDDATDPQFWLSLHEAGYVIANAYKAVGVSLSLNSGNLTFLPLLKPPLEGRPHRIISFGFVNGNHFVSLNLKPDAPIPRVDCLWDTTVSKAAEVWKTPYLGRFDKFEEIMGINLGQRVNTGSRSLPIIIEP